MADTARNAGAAIKAGRQPPETAAQLTTHAEATGFARGFLTSAFIAVLALVIAIVAIRVRRQDLAGAEPMATTAATTSAEAPADTGAEAGVPVLVPSERAARAAAAIPCRHC